MFEEMTEEYFMQQAVEFGSALGVDTRQGSIYMDAAMGHCIRTAKFFEDLRSAFQMLAIDTATEEILDGKASEHGVERLPSTPSKWGFLFSGTTPNVGERFFIDGYFFVLKNEDDTYYLESEIAGIETNSFLPGEAIVPVNNIKGLTASSLGDLISPGTDKESDDSLRTRLKEKIAGPAENGNKQHYKTWCEEVSGVGRARIMPLWAGENTVKAVLVDTEGLPPKASIVDAVQEYIDPGSTGLGEGVANLGAHFTAVAATGLVINLSFTVVLTDGATKATAQAEATEAITNYFKKLALESPENELIVVRVSSIGSIITGLSSVLDYSNLLLNGESANIQPDGDSVAILGEVTVDVSV